MATYIASGGELDDQPVEHEAALAGGLHAIGSAPDEAFGLEVLQPRLVELSSIDGRKPLLIDTFGEAQAHQQILVGGVLRGQSLVLLDAMA